jgi:carbonic anhydrase
MMSLTANQSYVEGFGDKGSLAMPPARQFAILTCMDARLDPARFAGLAEGDAHVIRRVPKPRCVLFAELK